MPNLSHEEHAGLDPLDLQRKGLNPASMPDFSVHSNPFGPSPCVIKVLRRVDISGYPDNHGRVPADKLAGLNCVKEDQALIANDTTKLIRRTASLISAMRNIRSALSS
ncbi:MAG: hypothetical protein GYA52_11900 [Chloroflexi bacterium]|nr:hypothetical protein [Chloroflexota bacterium]